MYGASIVIAYAPTVNDLVHLGDKYCGIVEQFTDPITDFVNNLFTLTGTCCAGACRACSSFMTLDSSSDLSYQAVGKFNEPFGMSGKKDITGFNTITRSTNGRGPPRFCQNFGLSAITVYTGSAAGVTFSTSLIVVSMLLSLLA